MNKNTEQKRENEKKLISQMINIYCKSNHKAKNGCCSECEELEKYSHMRIDKCPFMENKTFCSNCRVHCFKQDKRAEIKEVMKFSGKRMIFHHPVIAINHVIQLKKQKNKIKKQAEIDNEQNKKNK